MDPLLFQSYHPDTGVYFWFSVLDAPGSAAREDKDDDKDRGQDGKYKVQLGISWPVCDLEKDQEVIQSIPNDTEVVEVTLADWEGPESSGEDGGADGGGWDNRNGRVTLIGDAAHAMTICRGEAANRGILDVVHLVSAIEKINAGQDSKSAIGKYGAEMKKRGQTAARLSRRACIEAHEWEKLNEGSAILARRKLD
ncbi:FAD-dependent oxidoreductase [Aspergillus undulatus]|uniref:FAD-dependent oxidoreductase n=1 Tax=Aspergillus undulatus TaxID=1810928 RepID=UPI003CCD44DA